MSTSTKTENGEHEHSTGPTTTRIFTEVNFLCLPCEIRDMIYELYLTAGRIDIVVWNGKPFQHHGFFSKRHGDRQGWLHENSFVALTQYGSDVKICLTISQEASATFYGKSTFVFPHENI
ncbi:hypothetical protein HYALB_00003926 [Hymenoscyphus albidus]|uniref:Uncharacterized protein n=1 Tax=Hymenoscyphus albidus TaxID=595503 RepID=A0A9N9Q4R6_9HELO|nr:hypothetical protein HYALB_00003926 [Hymenoscyphus albidus]